MNLIELSLFGHEIVVEKHKKKPASFFSWEFVSTREIFLDVGEISVIYSNTNKTKHHRRAVTRGTGLLIASLAGLCVLLAGSEAGATLFLTLFPLP